MAWETVKRVQKCKNQRVSIRLYCILLPYYTIHTWLPYSKDKSGKIVHWVIPLLPLVTYNVFLPHLEKFDLQNLICSLTKLLGILGIGLIGIGSISGICFLFVPNIYNYYQTDRLQHWHICMSLDVFSCTVLLCIFHHHRLVLDGSLDTWLTIK